MSSATEACVVIALVIFGLGALARCILEGRRIPGRGEAEALVGASAVLLMALAVGVTIAMI
jgi:hypothetical protein